MLKRIPIAAAALALATLSALAPAQELSVKRTPKADQTIKYALKVEGLKASDVSGTFTGTMQERVKEIKPDGTFALEQILTNATFRVGENDFPAGDMPPSTMTFKANGEVDGIEGAEDAGTEYRISTLSVLVDPGKALKVGDEWTHEFKADKKRGARSGRGEYKLLAEEKVGAYDTLKIKAVVRETEGAEPAASDGTIWIDKADGSVVKYEAKWTRAPFPGLGAHDVTVTLTREG